MFGWKENGICCRRCEVPTIYFTFFVVFWDADCPPQGNQSRWGIQPEQSGPCSSASLVPRRVSQLARPGQWAMKRRLLESSSGKALLPAAFSFCFIEREDDAALSPSHWERPSELQKYCWVFLSYRISTAAAYLEPACHVRKGKQYHEAAVNKGCRTWVSTQQVLEWCVSFKVTSL